MRTEVGRIGALVESVRDERTPLELRLDALGRRLIWLTLLAAGVVVAAGVLRGRAWSVMLETGIALAIAAVPEGLPAVITIALAVGIHRMARRRALVRRLPAVEALGSTTIICTDKTGTLTAGEQTVTEMSVADSEVDITGVGYQPLGAIQVDGRPFDAARDHAVALALRIAVLANDGELRATNDAYLPIGDPTDAALLVAALKAGIERGAMMQQWPREAEVPFSSERQLMATFHRHDGALVACVKGAPARAIALCARALARTGTRALDDRQREALLEQNRRMAARGLRVLALAHGSVSAATESALQDLTFVGFAGMIDPPAADVPETIARFRAAGIRTVMLTGDQRLTAEAIARDLGVLQNAERVVEARELAAHAAGSLADVIRDAGAFSRVSPETKLQLVSAFQEQGEIVAMLGDGVNDAAALKKADVGVAMGVRGTDVAREAADVVLSDDRFQTVAAAIEEGRVIYDNIRKFVFYLFSCNLAEVLLLLIAALAGLPVPLTPLQLLWLNIVTDTFPALSLALEPAEPDIMRRPPRDPDAAIMSRRFVRSIFTYAALITAVTLGAFLYALGSGDAVRAGTFAFMTLAFAQLFHLGNARSAQPLLGSRRALGNRWALGAVAVVIALQVLAVHAGPLARVLGVTPLSAADWFIVVSLAAIPAVFGQLVRHRAARG
jgi:Ca2+-transporting ATPase